MDQNDTPRVSIETEVEFLGVDHPSYFQGFGVDDFDDCAHGVGSTPREALEEALEQLASGGWVHLREPDPSELGSDVDRDLAGEALEESIRDELPAEAWVAVHYSRAMGARLWWQEDLESEGEALEALQERADLLRADGFELDAEPFGREYEVLEPDDVAMVPDEVGRLSIESNVDEREALRERMEEDSEGPYCYVGVRVMEGEVLRKSPTLDELRTVEGLRLEATRRARVAWEEHRERTIARRWYLRAENVRGGGDHPLGPSSLWRGRLAFRAPALPYDRLAPEVRERHEGPLLTELCHLARAVLRTTEDPLEGVAELLGEDVSDVLYFEDGGPGSVGCSYVDTGDTYGTTLLVEDGSGVVSVGSWGDALEGAEQARTEETGELRCAYCGEWTGTDGWCHPEHFDGIPGAMAESALRELEEAVDGLGFEDPREVAEAAGRSAYLSRWADAEEAAGRSLGGSEIAEVAPEGVPPEFLAWGAQAVRMALEAARDAGVVEAWVGFQGEVGRVEGMSLLGHLLGMSAQGHGVGPEDEDLPGVHPWPYLEAPDVVVDPPAWVAEVAGEDGKFPTYAWPGGYPIIYVADDGETFCAKCARGEDGSEAGPTADPGSGWRLVGWQLHMEGPPETCAHCGVEVASAYGEVEP